MHPLEYSVHNTVILFQGLDGFYSLDRRGDWLCWVESEISYGVALPACLSNQKACGYEGASLVFSLDQWMNMHSRTWWKFN